MVYSADLGTPEDLEPLLGRPCDLLVCEMAHFTPKTLFAYLRDKPVRRLCLTHFSPELDTQIDEIRLLGAETMRDTERVEF